MPLKKIIDGRKKRIPLLKRRKSETKLEKHDAKFYLVKKIIKILKTKEIPPTERYTIVNYFISELPADRKLTNHYGKIKKLFHWLSSAGRETILFQYSDWEQKLDEEKSTRYL